MSSEEQWFKNQRKRYQDTLRLNYVNYCNHGVFTDLPTTIKLLKQILELSSTAEGRAKIHKIDPNLIRYCFIDSLKIWWRQMGYWQFDNLALKIMANLILDPLFFKQGFDIKVDMIDLIKRSYSKNFENLGGQVVKNIIIAEQKMKEETKIIKYKQSFQNKEEAISELQIHTNFFNFSGSSVHFTEEYPYYVGMLRGALKVGAQQKVIDIFPKGCFGCVVFSMIVTGYRSNNRQLAITFLQELTDGWFTSVLYNCLLNNIKSLYKHLEYNLNLQDPYELVCLRLTSYKITKPIFQYLQKIGGKMRDGKLPKIKRVTHQSILYYQLEKIKYKDKLSQQSSNIRSIYREISQKSKQYFDISKILSVDQTAIMREAMIKKCQNLGFNIKQVKLKYCYEQSLHKYKLYFADCPTHMVIVIQYKNGNILMGYFQNPQPWYKIIGNAYFFQFSHLNSYEVGELNESVKFCKKKIHRNQKQEKDKKFKDNSKDISEIQQQFEQEKYYSFRRPQFRDFECERQSSQNSQPFSSSDEEEKTYLKNKKFSHKICFVFPRDEFKMFLRVKQSETSVNQSLSTDKQSQSIVKQTKYNGELESWAQFLLKTFEGKMVGDELRIQIQKLQIFELECQKIE